MTSQEGKLLMGLAPMRSQYLTVVAIQSERYLDHKFMSAGEACIECLAHYGLVTPSRKQQGRGREFAQARRIEQAGVYIFAFKRGISLQDVVPALPRSRACSRPLTGSHDGLG